MAIASAICNTFKADVLNAVHLPSDVYKIALYTSSADLGAHTETYTMAGEVSGEGYSSGGAVLTGRRLVVDGGVAIIDWSDDPTWRESTIKASGALIYNATRGNRAIAVCDFGSEITSTAGPFTVELPEPTAKTGLVRIG